MKASLVCSCYNHMVYLLRFDPHAKVSSRNTFLRAVNCVGLCSFVQSAHTLLITEVPVDVTNEQIQKHFKLVMLTRRRGQCFLCEVFLDFCCAVYAV